MPYGSGTKSTFEISIPMGELPPHFLTRLLMRYSSANDTATIRKTASINIPLLWSNKGLLPHVGAKNGKAGYMKVSSLKILVLLFPEKQFPCCFAAQFVTWLPLKNKTIKNTRKKKKTMRQIPPNPRALKPVDILTTPSGFYPKYACLNKTVPTRDNTLAVIRVIL